MILTYNQYLIESSIKSVYTDMEKKLKELDLGNLKNISSEDGIAFFNAVLKADGDIHKVKKDDLSEQAKPLNEALEIIEILGEVGEILGTSAAVQFILGKIGNKLGSNSDITDIGKKVYSVVKWITAATGVEGEIIQRGFAFIARHLGANGVKAQIVGKAGLAVTLAILLVCSFIVFPAIVIGGSGTFSCILAGIASIAKMREIGKLCLEVWDEIKHPEQVDIEEFPSFFDLISNLFQKNHEVNPIPQ